MKILHIDTGLEWRGGQRQALILHNGLINKGFVSNFIVNKHGALFEYASENGFENIHSFEFNSEFSKISKKTLWNYFQKIKPDIIHCHDSHSVALARIFKGMSVIFHTRRVSYPINILSRFLKYRYIDYHVCVSRDIESYMRKYFKNVSTIASCVDTNKFKNTGKLNLVLDKKCSSFLYVGAFSKQKGVEILLKSFAVISKEFNSAKLTLIGSGELELDLKKLCKKLEIENSVIFLGEKKNIEKFYNLSQILIVPSIDGEGSSGVIKEGLASGNIVIASDLDANKEIINHKHNGFLFTNKNIDSLVYLMRNILLGIYSINVLHITESIKELSCDNQLAKYIKLYKTSLK